MKGSSLWTITVQNIKMFRKRITLESALLGKMAVLWKPEAKNIKVEGIFKDSLQPKKWNLCLFLFSLNKGLKRLSEVGMGKEEGWKETSALLLWKFLFIHTHIYIYTYIKMQVLFS